jgi:DNA-binding MarR family transcriptional regulator
VSASEIDNQAERLYLFVQHFGRRLRDVDIELNLTPARFSVLTSLAYHGKANVGELAAFERVRRPSMTRLVRDMERARLVRRVADPADGRGVIVELTTKGLNAVGLARRKKIEIVRRLLKAEGAASKHALAVALNALDAMAEDRGHRGNRATSHL